MKKLLIISVILCFGFKGIVNHVITIVKQSNPLRTDISNEIHYLGIFKKTHTLICSDQESKGCSWLQEPDSPAGTANMIEAIVLKEIGKNNLSGNKRINKATISWSAEGVKDYEIIVKW